MTYCTLIENAKHKIAISVLFCSHLLCSFPLTLTPILLACILTSSHGPRKHNISFLSLRNRDIPYEVPALPLRRVKQKRLRVQTRPTPQTKPDLKSLAGEEEEHPCEASSSSSPPSSSVQLPSAPSIVQSESVNASYQQKSDTPFQEQHQAPQPVQHSQQRFYQQQSIAPNSGRRPLYGLSPKEAAARSLQPNATVYPVSLSQHMDKKKEVPLSKRMRYIGWSDIQKALIQWMKTGDTLTRVCSKENAGPLGIGKVYEEVAELVKEKTSRWDFNSESARQEIGNIVRRVRGANIVTNSTGSGTYGNRKIEEQREALCPEYKDLWPVVQGIPNTKFAGLTKSSLPPILHCSKPLTPRPLAPLPHTSFKLQPPPPAVAAIVAAAENIESEGIGVSLCPCAISVVIEYTLMRSLWFNHD